jgi:hypothetical protein
MKPNSGVRNLIVVAGCLVGLLALHVACGGTEEAPLPGAVYAKGIPMYPGAKYVGSMGGQSSDSIGGPTTGESQSWFFKFSDPVEEVVAFYKGKLPGAELKSDDEGGSTFTLKLPEAEKGEYVQVIVHRYGNLQIHESLKPGKKRA